MSKEESKQRNAKGIALAAMGLCLGVALLLYGSFGGTEKKTAAESGETLSAEAYRADLEATLAALCASVRGAGRVSVFVTLEGGYEYVYATDDRGECVTVGSGSSERAVVERVIAPRISGVGIVCEGASDPVVECLMVPDLSLAVAEAYALRGKRVLCLLTDMTNFSDALKEISITMEQIPSNRGYPGDLYSQLASRYEKAVDFDGAGSITILAVTTMPGDDVTHPVPDNTGYITEGQFYLRNGRIEPFGSLSRLKQQVNGRTRPDHRAIMDAMIRLYSDYKSTLEKQSMGFKMSAWDSKLLKYGSRFENEMMSLSVNIPLEEGLDLGWKILADCFDKTEVGIKTDLLEEYWPEN